MVVVGAGEQHSSAFCLLQKDKLKKLDFFQIGVGEFGNNHKHFLLWSQGHEENSPPFFAFGW